MSSPALIEYNDATPEVKAVFDDIMATRKVDSVNNFWKALANDPATLRRIWESLKTVMGPGVLDPVTKELIYIAVSVANQCSYCIASHSASARKKGLTEEGFGELMAIIGLASQTNALVAGYRVPLDEQFK